jgi:hypothetical protein
LANRIKKSVQVNNKLSLFTVKSYASGLGQKRTHAAQQITSFGKRRSLPSASVKSRSRPGACLAFAVGAAATPRNCDLTHRGALSLRIIYADVLVAELRGIADHKIATMITRELFSSGKQSIRSLAIKDLRHRNTSWMAKASGLRV